MKIERHSQIIRLISQYDIETQEELAEKLNESGFRVTQATVSRDIRELKLTKISKPGGGSRYAVLQSVDQEMSRKYTNVLRTSFQSMDLAQNILIVKTVSGMAMAAAAALDADSGDCRQHRRGQYADVCGTKCRRRSGTDGKDSENDCIDKIFINMEYIT